MAGLRANDGQLDLAAPIVLTKPADDSKCELILTGTAGATLESVAIVSNARNVELYINRTYVSTIRGEAVAGARDRFRVAAAPKGAAMVGHRPSSRSSFNGSTSWPRNIPQRCVPGAK